MPWWVRVAFRIAVNWLLKKLKEELREGLYFCLNDECLLIKLAEKPHRKPDRNSYLFL